MDNENDLLLHTAIWLTLTNIKLTKVSQTQKNTDLSDSIYIKYETRQNYNASNQDHNYPSGKEVVIRKGPMFHCMFWVLSQGSVHFVKIH